MRMLCPIVFVAAYAAAAQSFPTAAQAAEEFVRASEANDIPAVASRATEPEPSNWNTAFGSSGSAGSTRAASDRGHYSMSGRRLMRMLCPIVLVAAYSAAAQSFPTAAQAAGEFVRASEANDIPAVASRAAEPEPSNWNTAFGSSGSAGSTRAASDRGTTA